MQTYEKEPARTHIVEEFHFQPADRSNPNGSLQVWGSRFNGLWNEPFYLMVGSDELDSLLFFLHKAGDYEPASMTPSKFFDASRDIYYSHSRKCNMISDWMQSECDREAEAAAQSAAEAMNYEHMMHEQWKQQQNAAAYELANEWP